MVVRIILPEGGVCPARSGELGVVVLVARESARGSLREEVAVTKGKEEKCVCVYI